MRAVFLALLLSLAFQNTKASNENPEARVRALEEKLRCLVCQNQTLADSPSELATDLRREVREQVKAGRTDGQILDFMVQRYGDFVLYEPRFKASTVLLWLGPFALLAGALAFLVLTLRRRRDAPEEPALGAAERQVVERVLGPGHKDGEAK